MLRGDLDGLGAAVKEAGADVNARDSAKNTPLHWAAASGGVDAARLLLDAGADLTLRGAGGDQPLHIAAAHGPRPRPACAAARDMQLEQLAGSRLPRGSGAPARGTSARRPLTASRAWRAGRVAFLELLVSRGGNLDSQNDGWPRHRARPQPQLRPHALRRATESSSRPCISAESSNSTTARAEGLTARHMINLLVEQNPLA